MNEKRKKGGKSELTGTAIAIGVLLAVIFGGANAYLGLRVGMTVSASIPAAVVFYGDHPRCIKTRFRAGKQYGADDRFSGRVRGGGRDLYIAGALYVGIRNGK